MTQKGMMLSGVPMRHEHDGDQGGCHCGERRPSPRHEQRHDSKHVQDDRDQEGAGGDVLCEPRLESGRQHEHDGQGDSPGAAREQTPRLHKQPLDVQRVHGPILVAPGCGASRQQTIFGLTPESDEPTKLTAARRPKDSARRDAADRRALYRLAYALPPSTHPRLRRRECRFVDANDRLSTPRRLR